MQHEELIADRASAHSIRSLDLPIALFDDLVSAFGQDTMTTRYASWADVLDYCRRSANPVGRLVLRIAGYRDEALDRSSDALCTALQLTNFWQDFGRDWRAGRLYVPRRGASAPCGAREAELAAGRMTAAWADALERVRPVHPRAVRGRPRGVRRRRAAGCGTSCGSPGSAACASSTRSSGRAAALLDSRPTLGARTCRCCSGAPCAGGDAA